MRRIQRTTIAGVGLLAGIAAAVSFRHMHELCLRHSEDRLAALLVPSGTPRNPAATTRSSVIF
ncbi:DUF2637 domain-containing protein [Nonomuraea basaltis]|uniref:DUF2637 domain-containing protein n=1 Tax=Nonomuraea basaltis TaxID=2495887 RepID=UPI00110C4A47|nr:DUF2637 domain-containing protein [Nonomuraea basaltis]TMR88704.1 DUF2637 domain-containing protein [Nonomuraea basaltis]